MTDPSKSETRPDSSPEAAPQTHDCVSPAPQASARSRKAAVPSKTRNSPGPGLEYAGFWRRYLAFLIDFPVSLVLAIAAAMAVGILLPPAIGNNVLLTTAIMLFTQFMYFSAMESSAWKGTLGKRLLKLRVTDTRGQRLTVGRACARTAAKALSFMTFFGGFVFAAFTRKKQGLHDRVAQTLVIRKAEEGILPVPVRRFELPAIVIAAIVLTLLLTQATGRALLPSLQRVQTSLAVVKTMQIMDGARKEVEKSLTETARPPTQLARELLAPQGAAVRATTVYSPYYGSLTVTFNGDPLKGTGFVLTPVLDQRTRQVTWRCSTINMPAEIVPSNCAGPGR